MVSGFMAEHNMPFSQADHLVDVLKKAFPDSEIAKDVSVKKTKASYIGYYSMELLGMNA